MSTADCTGLLLDFEFIEDIRRMEQALARDDVLSGFVRDLENELAGFGAAFSGHLDRGDAKSAVRAAHTLKSACGQLGAQALGALFADIERSAKAGDYAQAQQTFGSAADLITQSLEALKRA